MSFDLTNRNISDSFDNLLQKTGSDNQLYDLKGNPIVDLTIDGTLHAQSYIVSESTTFVTSGSNIFGNSDDDTHYFLGNITASNVISASGTLYALAGKFANQGEFTGSGNIHPALGIHGKLQITTGSKTFQFVVDDEKGTLTLLSGSTPVLKFGSKASNTGSFIEAQGNISASGNIFLDNTSHIYFKSASSAGASVKNIDVVFVSNNNVPRFGDGSMVYETLVFGQGAVMTISGSCFGMGTQTSINAGDLSSLEPTKTLTVNGDISASGDYYVEGGSAIYFTGGANEETFIRNVGSALYISADNDLYLDPDNDLIGRIQGIEKWRYDDGLDAFGIGTTTPDEKLTVSGSISASGTTFSDHFIGGKSDNSISTDSTWSSILGGHDNTIVVESFYSIIGAGLYNKISGSANSMIGVGAANEISSSDYSIIGAGVYNTIFEGNSSIIGTGEYNIITDSEDSIIGAGDSNKIKKDSNRSMIGAGQFNTIVSSDYSIIGAGYGNTMSGSISSSILGGEYNHIPAYGNVHIIGSNISASQANTTFTENIIAKGDISASGGFPCTFNMHYASNKSNPTTWNLYGMGGLSTVLGGTDIVVGNEEDVTIDGATGGLLKSLFFIVPYNMRIDKLSWMVQDDDGNVDGGADSRVGLWTVDSMAAEDTITTISGTKTFTLRYISSAFGQTAGDGKGFFDTNTAVDLTEGQGVFVGYLNPDSDGIDTRVINFTIWTNPSKGLL